VHDELDREVQLPRPLQPLQWVFRFVAAVPNIVAELKPLLRWSCGRLAGEGRAGHDGGVTWDVENEIVLRDDGPELDLGWPPGWDLGYPATVEIEPGELLTVYYQIDPPDHKPSIQATRWSLR
jgi:hypothetical protein